MFLFVQLYYNEPVCVVMVMLMAFCCIEILLCYYDVLGSEALNVLMDQYFIITSTLSTVYLYSLLCNSFVHETAVELADIHVVVLVCVWDGRICHVTFVVDLGCKVNLVATLESICQCGQNYKKNLLQKCKKTSKTIVSGLNYL